MTSEANETKLLPSTVDNKPLTQRQIHEVRMVVGNLVSEYEARHSSDGYDHYWHEQKNKPDANYRFESPKGFSWTLYDPATGEPLDARLARFVAERWPNVTLPSNFAAKVDYVLDRYAYSDPVYPETERELLDGKSFTMREKHKLTLPGGNITEDGISLLRSAIYSAIYSAQRAKGISSSSADLLALWQFHIDLVAANWQWTATVKGKGEYVGTFSKRISKFVKKHYDLNLSKETLARIGNLVAQHTEKPLDLTLDFTDQIDWVDGEFGKWHSCWFTGAGGYGGSLDMMALVKGIAVRFWRKSDGYGFARAWILPQRPESDTFIVFNGYGLLDEYGSTMVMARALATWLGYSYKRIDYRVTAARRVYINGNYAYLVGPAETLAKYSDIHDTWESEDTRVTRCCNCDTPLTSDDLENVNYRNGEVWCETCFDEAFTFCDACEEYAWNDEFHSVYCYYDVRPWSRPNAPVERRREHILVCQSCYDRDYTRCDICDDNYENSEMHDLADGGSVCTRCAESHCATCAECGERFDSDTMTQLGEEDSRQWLCAECDQDHAASCEVCGYHSWRTEYATVDGNWYCNQHIPTEQEDENEEETIEVSEPVDVTLTIVDED